jgi:hypothetical protein
MKQLRSLLFGQGRQPKESPESEASPSSSDGLGQDEDGDEPAPRDEAELVSEAAGDEVDPGTSESTPKPRGGHRQGTGRLGAAAYVGAKHTECRHEELAVGQTCPVWGQGTLYELPPGSEIRIDGHALLSAMHDELQKLRCSACGQIFTASLPRDVGEEKYSARARAVLVVSRYDLGLPFYRLQGYQAMLGVPVPDSTQWDQIEKVGDYCYVVFEYFEFLAAQGEVIHPDDTSVRIVTLIKDNQAFTRRPRLKADHGPRSVPACSPPRWSSRWVSGPSVCTTRGGLMRGEPRGAVEAAPSGSGPPRNVGCADAP